FVRDAHRREASGKYAVSVAMTARWANVDEPTLNRALALMQESVDSGNDGPEARRYLAELYIEAFNQCGDIAQLALAKQHATVPGTNNSVHLQSEIELKFGLQ